MRSMDQVIVSDDVAMTVGAIQSFIGLGAGRCGHRRHVREYG